MTAFLFSFLTFFGSVFSEPAVTLKVEIGNLKSSKGKLLIGIYKPGGKFTDGKPVESKIIEVNSKSNQLATFALEPGRYAIALYHDLNGNGVMDKNFVGIPKEPYGFSKDFRPKLSAPSFEDCAFDLPASGKSISVKLTD
ncbi:DUF2141 domain-containing protein [Dyadobacter psychrotolerans]|uniref:DUF2141 domain-containing protein n=1 Tax=Dyadobacter psychrotolerans TaxID=2541721 RepID=A0A4R5DFJ7_9BACT|nr:DUF2141 domain-containing protein [Dyadobacter psychrotolerans]TDE11947.1 DUF2141 domain-containing protein [Dyadobacter psychrotolerans]